MSHQNKKCFMAINFYCWLVSFIRNSSFTNLGQIPKKDNTWPLNDGTIRLHNGKDNLGSPTTGLTLPRKVSPKGKPESRIQS